MSWRKQNVLSVVAIVALVALNTLLPGPDAPPGKSATLIAHR